MVRQHAQTQSSWYHVDGWFSFMSLRSVGLHSVVTYVYALWNESRLKDFFLLLLPENDTFYNKGNVIANKMSISAILLIKDVLNIPLLLNIQTPGWEGQ